MGEEQERRERLAHMYDADGLAYLIVDLERELDDTNAKLVAAEKVVEATHAYVSERVRLRGLAVAIAPMHEALAAYDKAKE